jgi:hypothetical protein
VVQRLGRWRKIARLYAASRVTFKAIKAIKAIMQFSMSTATWIARKAPATSRPVLVHRFAHSTCHEYYSTLMGR